MRKLTLLEKWSYAIGNIPYAVKDTAYTTFVVFYYTQVQGLSGTLSGLAMFIALVWDAISDPIVGSWSDRIRSRWGRRHSLMAIGTVPTAILFLFLFSPPASLSQLEMFSWLLVVSILLRTFLTLYFIPYQAMGAEMSTNYDERTSLANARITVAWIGGMALPAIAYALIFQPKGDMDGRLIAGNYWDYGVMSAVLALSTAILCLWGTRTTIPLLPKSLSASTAFSLLQPFRDLLKALEGSNFRYLMCTTLAFGIGAGTYLALNLYLGTYFWEFSADQLAGIVVPVFLGTVTVFSLLGRLSRNWDKPQLLTAFCLIGVINALWFIGGRLLGLWPENGHVIIYPLLLLNSYIAVFCMVGVQIVGASLLADIVDEQQLTSGERQEGLFFSASTFVYKATTGLGTFMAGIVIEFSGLPTGAIPGSVDNSVLFTLGLYGFFGMFLPSLVSWIYAAKVRLSRDKVARIHRQLADQLVA